MLMLASLAGKPNMATSWGGRCFAQRWCSTMSAMERGDGVEKPKRTRFQFFVLKSETEIQEMTH